MKRFAVGLMLSLTVGFAGVLRADEISDNINEHLNQAALDVLAQDLGAMVSAGSFHQGKALGFPLGFDVGVHAGVVGIQDDNPILADDESRWGGVFGQVEVGLPFKLDAIVRGGSLGSGTVLGGGLRWGIIKTDVPGLPSVSLSGLYNQMDHDFLDLKNYSGNVVASFNVPIIHPYIGAGYDYTEADPTSKAYVGAPGSPDTSLKGTSDGYRVEAGVNLSLIPFTYITLGAGLANSEELYHLGLGAKF